MDLSKNTITEIYKYLSDRDDSTIDRLNRLYTVAFLTAFVSLVTTNQYIVGHKIQCWTPNDFTNMHITYAHDICWLGQTNYYVNETIRTLDSPSDVREYPFLIYPWLPILLLLMTGSFALPYIFIWRVLSKRSSFNINRLMKISDNDLLCKAIDFILWQKYQKKQSGRAFILYIYLLMKVSYICNLCIQILFIHKLLLGYYFPFNFLNIFNILSVHYNMWSSVGYLFQLFKLSFILFSFATKKAHLPIETMCGESMYFSKNESACLFVDFMIRMLGQNNNWYTIQCILPYNLFTKRIFAVLFLWFIVLLILTIINLVLSWSSSTENVRFNYVANLLDLHRKYVHKDEGEKTAFYQEVLKDLDDRDRAAFYQEVSKFLDAKNSPEYKDFIYQYLGM